MADDQPDKSEKTEDPSQKKLDEALKKGDVAKSQELSSFFVLAGATLVVAAFSGYMTSNLTLSLRKIFMNAHDIRLDQGQLLQFTDELGSVLFFYVGLPLLTLILMAIAGNLMQHPPLMTLDPLKPKFSKVSPLAGFKRLFSQESLMSFLKGLLKITFISIVVGAVLWPERDRLDAIIHSDVSLIMSTTYWLALKVLGGALAVMFIIGFIDFAWQKHRWWEKQKMTVKEVKDEFKQQEGDPTIKAKLRQIRLERSRKRMMAAVPDATVIVTNPTHYAVALKYDGEMETPICLAKGVDQLALKIRQIARENEIPIVENPPLARSLHATVELDEEIQPEHYRAVADIIGFVQRLSQKKRRNF